MPTEDKAHEQTGQGSHLVSLTPHGAPLVLPALFLHLNLSLSPTSQLSRKKRSMHDQHRATILRMWQMRRMHGVLGSLPHLIQTTVTRRVPRASGPLRGMR